MIDLPFRFLKARNQHFVFLDEILMASDRQVGSQEDSLSSTRHRFGNGLALALIDQVNDGFNEFEIGLL